MIIDLEGLMRRFRGAETDEERAAINQEILDRYNVTGALLVLDMSGFSRITREKGIVHFLALVQEMQDVVIEEIKNRNGEIIKFFSDNCFAWFESPYEAVECAVRMMQASQVIHEESAEPLKICIGIDYGEFLLIEGNECFGHTVNRACKLGEDIADTEEILVSVRAVEAMDNADTLNLERRRYDISGIEIDAYKVIY